MITRCVCYDVTFEEIKRLRDEHGIGRVEEVRQFVRFGENCGLCLPYVERVLQDGTTAFEWQPEDQSG